MMKRNLLLALLCFAATLGLKSQNLHFGVKAGLNLTTLIGDVEDAETLAGFHAGVVADFKIGEKFSIQPELLYSQEGAKFSSDSEMRLHYLNLPVLAKYYISETFSLEAGPQIGYLTSAELDDVSGTADIRDFLDDISFGASIGAAYLFDIRVFLQARYHIGIGDIIKNDSPELNPGIGKIRNSGFQLSVGYKF